MYLDLRAHIDSVVGNLEGSWVAKKSSYESDACKGLGFKCEMGRYADASWNNYSIELKKGTSIWIDIVRYSEILLDHPHLNVDTSVTLFLVPDKDKSHISDVVCVPTSRLISKLNLDKEAAKVIVSLKEMMPRQLNAQASLTVKDVKEMSVFSSDMISSLLR
ncbi:hypothetical protein [Acinetobacter sp. ANC5681]|jgi:hypothetical protein|uniref:hypothetical protein n=1 Tax=Acinetobacter sp. ANC5681 TaxID=2929504 RepID=UPI00201A59AB|nr:hypothetical protein [Acinetobacter sp. ANC5681]MCL5769516.1 hypothetical protein [Acinetobacter sp. ANC5681]